MDEQMKQYLIENNPNGISKKFCEDCGKLSSIGVFNNGIPIGDHTTYDCDEFIMMKTIYIDGYDEWEKFYYYYVESKDDYEYDKIKEIEKYKNGQTDKISFSEDGLVTNR